MWGVMCRGGCKVGARMRGVGRDIHIYMHRHTHTSNRDHSQGQTDKSAIVY